MDIVVTITDLVLGMLAGIAAIALLVGGIGIMNMMLVSVSERTVEIGLRKALGAKPSVIMVQFLVEAVIISMFGGVLGVAFGAAIAYVASILIGYAFAFQATTVLLAVGFSVTVGLIFGILPARKAAKLNPIDALRAQ
jgi:putative ABC transport system permease protein